MVYYTEKREVMDWQIWAAVLPVLAGIVGVWVNLNSEVARLKSRIIQVELSQDEFKTLAKELLITVHKIEIMLAKMEKE